jgi:hypothetical protein
MRLGEIIEKKTTQGKNKHGEVVEVKGNCRENTATYKYG